MNKNSFKKKGIPFISKSYGLAAMLMAGMLIGAGSAGMIVLAAGTSLASERVLMLPSDLQEIEEDVCGLGE